MNKQGRRGGSQRQSYWQEVLRRWREGGQSVRAFCRAEGLRESAFYFWRRELDRGCQRADAVIGSPSQVRTDTPAARLPKRASSRHTSPPSFLPVQVVKDGVTEATDGVEIILGPGRTVRVRAGFDRQTLADVLAVLEVRPC